MVGLGWMVRGDFLQMVFVEIQNKIACSITQRCHLRISKILGPKACKIQNILTKKVFQFHPYSDVFCWHVFFFHFSLKYTVETYTKYRPGKEWRSSTSIRTEVLRSWSGIAPCTECITSGLKATGSPRCLGSSKAMGTFWCCTWAGWR